MKEVKLQIVEQLKRRIPNHKRKELVDRVSAMVKGYNMTHGVDKHEIIYAGVIESN